jgi:pyruvate formate lyase activating enzyme
MATITLEQWVDSLTAEGELYQRHADGSLTCYACGHRCLIKPGRRGICKVRFNEDGVLKVPWGYVGALQCDPTEKKPFFHVYPGSDTLTFGMLGCDLHCPYCFPPETPVVTDRGVIPLADCFALAERTIQTRNGEVAHPKGLRAVAGSGKLRPVRQVFKHRYTGQLAVIHSYYLPELRCTPDHQVYATDDPARRPERLPASALTARHFLAVPRRYAFSSPQVVEMRDLLSAHISTFKTPHRLPAEVVERIMTASAAGVSSRELGRELGKDPSYIRHVRSKVRRGIWTESKAAELVVEENRVRFSKERRPGIPLTVAVDENLARLLGYYCAEGSVQKDKGRPNSYALVFTFGLHEPDLAEETRRLLESVFGVQATITPRRTTLAVTVTKSSVGLLFKSLCGTGSTAKRAPQVLFDAPRPVAEAFLDAYLRGDGHRTARGKTTVTTKSRALAYGVAWLGLKTSHLPALYENQVASERVIEGRSVQQSPVQYTVVWYETDAAIERKCVVTDDFYLVPIRSIERADYNGDVYNLEVEEEHNYLANFALVANCQNWITSQALRDPASEMYGAQPMPITPQKMAALARQQGAQLVGSSYNEPLITSEWAVAVFKEAVRAGLKCVYISNGNATREVLEYIRPYVSGYKIDLKTMSDKNYRRLGAVLQNVLDGIRLVHQMGFWLEIVTLVVPGFNDSNEELLDAAKFLAGLSPDIPWHVTAFHKDYKMTEPDNTTAQILLRAAEIGEEAGLRYVYAGNLPGQVGEYEHTFCPNCKARLIERYGYVILDYRLTAQGACPDCGTHIPGIWTDRPETVRLYGPGAPRAVTSAIRRFRSDTV